MQDRSRISVIERGAQGMNIAIVGSGPSGFYAAETLLNSEIDFSVDMFERLPFPFGLVRSGVAPDHPRLKSVISEYEAVAAKPGFRFFGNVDVGEDVSVDELREAYSAVIVATGAQADRSLDIPGEALSGSTSARAFVNWYNGHPDYREESFDLTSEVAVVVGLGNVALDVCRILLKPIDELRKTDIADHALEVLANSRVRDVHLIGRRGPAQMKISYKELRELSSLDQCRLEVAHHGLELNSGSAAELEHRNSRENVFNIKLLEEESTRTDSTFTRRCIFHFLRRPTRILGGTQVTGIELGVNGLEGEPFAQYVEETQSLELLHCGLVFRSIGYKGVPLPGVDFDETSHCVRHSNGRIRIGLYSTGWIKRGPSGVIGTNRADSSETVNSLLDDLPLLNSKTEHAVSDVLRRLQNKGVKIVSYSDWQKIDAVEKSLGEKSSRPRQKLVSVDEMLSCL